MWHSKFLGSNRNALSNGGLQIDAILAAIVSGHLQRVQVVASAKAHCLGETERVMPDCAANYQCDANVFKPTASSMQHAKSV